MRRLAALGALALLVAGCGGNGGGGGGGGGNAAASDPIARAAVKTSQAGSLQADFTIGGSSLNGSGTGVFDNDKRGSGRVAMAVRNQGQSVSVDTIIVGPVLYIRSPVFSQVGLPPGKKWVKLDLAQLAQQRGIDLGSLVNSNPNPSGALAYLRGSNGNVEKLGTEKVQGVDTTHYKATIQLARAAKRVSGRARDSINRVITVSGVKQIPVEAWIDDDGYIRKVTYTEHSGKKQSADITMELHDFGPHVAIASPPKASVIDFQQILQPGGG
jgi:hypothetical protein